MQLRFNQRIFKPELMDDLSLEFSKLDKVLSDLNIFNKLSFTSRILAEAVFDLTQLSGYNANKLQILDIGCGGGQVLCNVVQRLRAKGIDAQGCGIDSNPGSIIYALKNSNHAKQAVEFHCQGAYDAAKTQVYDIAISSLFLHHLPADEIITLFSILKQNARIGIVMTDLERSKWNYLLTWMATRLLSRSPIIRHDGLQSVKSSLTLAELAIFSREADLNDVQIARKFPFRLFLSWRQNAGFLRKQA